MDEKKLHNLLMACGHDGVQAGDMMGDELLSRVAFRVAQSYNMHPDKFLKSLTSQTEGVGMALHSGTVTMFTNCAAAIITRAIVGEIRALIEGDLESGLETYEDTLVKATGILSEIINSLVLSTTTNVILQINDERKDKGKPPFFGPQAASAAQEAKDKANEGLAAIFASAADAAAAADKADKKD